MALSTLTNLLATQQLRVCVMQDIRGQMATLVRSARPVNSRPILAQQHACYALQIPSTRIWVHHQTHLVCSARQLMPILARMVSWECLLQHHAFVTQVFQGQMVVRALLVAQTLIRVLWAALLAQRARQTPTVRLHQLP